MQEKITMRSKQLGEKIRMALIEMPNDEKGRWTQKRVAESLGINLNVFSRFLNGDGGLPDDKITQVAKMLDASFRIDRDGIDYTINPDGGKSY